MPKIERWSALSRPGGTDAGAGNVVENEEFPRHVRSAGLLPDAVDLLHQLEAVRTTAPRALTA